MDLQLEAGGGGGGGTRTVSLSADSPTADLGRGDVPGCDGAPSRDRTVSRRHVSLRLVSVGGGVTFEVVGRNPVVVRSPSRGGESESGRVFRRGEKGELRAGDALALSLKAPAFWAVRRKEGNGDGEGDVEAAVLDAVARRERRTRERKEKERECRAAEEAMEVTEEEKEEKEEEEEEGALGSDVEGLEIDLASIDPIREFGFLSMGHEFDSYPKGRIRAPKDWNWFLEETKRTSDDDSVEVTSRRNRLKVQSQKKKEDGEGEDEDWTGESEDEKESLASGPSVKRQKYVTRSKGPKKPRKENSKVESGQNIDEDEGTEDEEDETLGGFLVNDEDDEPKEELNNEEDEEEEFDEEEDD